MVQQASSRTVTENDFNAKVKVRFAPSPTGIPHVGNIRTALFNYFFAKANDGEFILRIEDTDQARVVDGAVDAIKESLNWLGVTWDQFVVQSERLNSYKEKAYELIEKGLAKEEEGAVRFIIPKDGITSWEDKVGGKKVEFKNSDIEDFIILKKDGFPTYHLANVIDDNDMKITHVIRGEDWIPSTPKHILLYNAFGWSAPFFVHVPNILGTDGKKLSKRKGAKSVLDFKNEGYLSQALLNYLMLLGWSPKDNREILSKEEIIKDFVLDKINVSPAIFDLRKLEWMNGEYIRSSQNSKIKSQILELEPKLAKFDQEIIEKLIEPAKTRMKTLIDFKDFVLPFVENKTEEVSGSEIRQQLGMEISEISVWNKEEIGRVLKDFLQSKNMRFPDLYELLISKKQGLPLSDVFEILGKDKTLEFIKNV